MSDQSSNANTASTESNATTPPAGTGNTSLNASTAPSASSTAAATTTMTITEEPATQTSNNGVLRLTLQDRRGVRWEEDVVDNEGLGRKSSKRCCIFHKARAFGESSTDTSDYDSNNENGKYSKHKKIAHKKKTPDHLRFHA